MGETARAGQSTTQAVQSDAAAAKLRQIITRRVANDSLCVEN
jgi:hypothetical protein